MSSATVNAWILAATVCISGCNGVRNGLTGSNHDRPVRPSTAGELLAKAEAPSDLSVPLASESATMAVTRTAAPDTQHSIAESNQPKHGNTGPENKLIIRPVGHSVSQSDTNGSGRITLDGRTYEIHLVDQSASHSPPPGLRRVHLASQEATIAETPFEPIEVVTAQVAEPIVLNDAVAPDAVLLNLPSALSMVGRDHPAVGLAQWKVQEAYANLDQAEVLWLPSIQTGLSFHKHDGNYQASNGDIVDVNRSSLQLGLGAGATGAGTTPNPGIRAQFHLADAIFQPDIAQKTAWASCHAEKAVVNRQLRDVAMAYINLLNAHQQLRILEDVRNSTASLSKITDDFAKAGQGLQADADRMNTELNLIDGRIAAAQEQADVASARLAYAVSADPGQKIVPMDPAVVPIELVSLNMDQASLIRTGLSNRPELKELQALVAAACDRYKRQKYAPFVPSVLLGLSAGGFGGDTGTAINSFDDRYDLDAMVTWEIRNFGFGERSARRRTEAQVQQAMFRKVSLIDNVAREITEAHTQVTHRRQRMAVTQLSIQTAQDSYNRNLSRIRDGEGLPIEVLQAVKALEASRKAYLDAVIDYNEAQFQLQWAMGWQVAAPQ